MPESQAHAAYGTLIEADDGAGNYTAIAEVVDITGPDQSRDTIDVTHMQSPNGYQEFIPSFKDGGNVTLTLNFLPFHPTQDDQTGIIADYINDVLTRITLVGALYLAVISIIPEFMLTGFHVRKIPLVGASLDSILPLWFTEGLKVQFYFGGTSLLIVVGVAMDTVQMIESQLVMRHYDGFLKKGRIRGRRG